MSVKRLYFHLYIAGIFVFPLLALARGAAAEPSITSAKIGKRELKGAAQVTIIKDDLTTGGEILIVGEADGGRHRVDRVEVSLDDGQTWKDATGRKRWRYRFFPIPNYTYYLTLRVINAAGEISDPKAFGITRLTYLPITLTELVQQKADELARAYMSKDLEGYMGLISRRYQNIPRGWHRLRKAIDNDFKSLHNIILRFTVNQVFELEGVIMADIHWKLTYAGLTKPKEGYVQIHFDPADQMKILVQKKDLYFGGAPRATP